MGAIVTVRVPIGADLQGIRNKIHSALSSITGEQISISINAVSQSRGQQGNTASPSQPIGRRGSISEFQSTLPDNITPTI